MSKPGVSDAVVEGCSGALGSVAAMLATYPLKTIYTLQALSTSDTKGAPAAGDPGARLLATLRFIQSYKLSTLYAGLGPNIIEAGLSSGVYFFFYSKLRELAVEWSKGRSSGTATDASRSQSIGVVASLLVATAAGAANQLITMPASVVATRMQGYQSLQGASSRPPTTWETIAAVFREDGVGGFWKGMLPSMILLANPAVQYMLFEKIKQLMRIWKSQRLARQREEAEAGGEKQPAAAAAGPVQLSAGEVFLAGALAKIGATVVTYPLIVVKARLQASKGGKDANAPYRASTWGVIAATARNEGLGGFFKGLRAKILQTALNAALMLMVKEQLHEVTRTALSVVAPAAATAPPS